MRIYTDSKTASSAKIRVSKHKEIVPQSTAPWSLQPTCEAVEKVLSIDRLVDLTRFGGGFEVRKSQLG